MTKSFGAKNHSTQTTSVASAPDGKKRKKRSASDYRESNFSPQARLAGKVGLGVISTGAVAFALWALFTDQAPFLTILLGMFVFAMVMTMIGKLIK